MALPRVRVPQAGVFALEVRGAPRGCSLGCGRGPVEGKPTRGTGPGAAVSGRALWRCASLWDLPCFHAAPSTLGLGAEEDFPRVSELCAGLWPWGLLTEGRLCLEGPPLSWGPRAAQRCCLGPARLFPAPGGCPGRDWRLGPSGAECEAGPGRPSGERGAHASPRGSWNWGVSPRRSTWLLIKKHAEDVSGFLLLGNRNESRVSVAGLQGRSSCVRCSGSLVSATLLPLMSERRASLVTGSLRCVIHYLGFNLLVTPVMPPFECGSGAALFGGGAQAPSSAGLSCARGSRTVAVWLLVLVCGPWAAFVPMAPMLPPPPRKVEPGGAALDLALLAPRAPGRRKGQGGILRLWV